MRARFLEGWFRNSSHSFTNVFPMVIYSFIEMSLPLLLFPALLPLTTQIHLFPHCPNHPSSKRFLSPSGGTVRLRIRRMERQRCRLNAAEVLGCNRKNSKRSSILWRKTRSNLIRWWKPSWFLEVTASIIWLTANLQFTEVATFSVMRTF